MRAIAIWLCVMVWFVNLILGVGAGYACLRLWHSRHHPLIGKLGLYINAFVVDVVASIALIFVARGTHLTWRFTGVWFISTFVSNILRAPLILFLIRGQKRTPISVPESITVGETSPSLWHERFDRLEEMIRETRPKN